MQAQDFLFNIIIPRTTPDLITTFWPPSSTSFFLKKIYPPPFEKNLENSFLKSNPIDQGSNLSQVASEVF